MTVLTEEEREYQTTRDARLIKLCNDALAEPWTPPFAYVREIADALLDRLTSGTAPTLQTDTAHHADAASGHAGGIGVGLRSLPSVGPALQTAVQKSAQSIGFKGRKKKKPQ